MSESRLSRDEGPARTTGSGLAEVKRDLVERLLSELLREGRPVQVEVTGSSMTPFIRSHDLVTLRPRAGQRAGMGQIVAVSRPAGYAWGTRSGFPAHRGSPVMSPKQGGER